MKRMPALRVAVLGFLLSTYPALFADSTTDTWTGNGSSSDFNNSGNWLGGTAPTGSGDEDVVFGNTENPVMSLNGDIALHDLTFNATNYAFYNILYFSETNSTITLNGGINGPYDDNSRGAYFGYNVNISLPEGDHVIDGGSGLYLYIDGEISGPGGIVTNGSTYLYVWNTANSFSGGLTINSGSIGLGNGAAGTGTISILGTSSYSAEIYNAGNGDLTLDNPLVLGSYATFSNYSGNLILNGSVTPADVSTVNIVTDGGHVVFFNGDISGTGVTYNFSSNYGTTTVLEGTNTYTGGTNVQNGALIFGTSSSIPDTGAIGVTAGAYAGIGDPTGFSRFLAHLSLSNTHGTIGLDSNPDGSVNTFNTDVDLSNFTDTFLNFGSISAAVLHGSFTPPTGAGAYNFGGSGALILENTSGLTDGLTPRSLHSATTVSSSEPFIVVLSGSATNDYTGGTIADGGGIVFDSANSVPANSTFTLNASSYSFGGYIGISETAGIDGVTFTPADLVARVAAGSHAGNSVIGFDSHDYIQNVISGGDPGSSTPNSVADLDLSSISGPIFVGSITKAVLTGNLITTSGGADSYYFTGYKGGELEVDSTLSDGETFSRSVTVGLPYVYDTDNSGTVRLTGANTYSGGTLLQSGELYLDGSTSGAPGEIVSGPIGTGPLTVDTWSGSATLGFGASPSTFANDIINYGDLHIESNNPSGVTLSGVICGDGRLIFDTSNPIALTNENTYSGGTQLNAANLTVTSDTGLGSGLVDLENGSSLVLTSIAPHIYGLSDSYYEGNTVTLTGSGSTLTIDAPPSEESLSSLTGSYPNVYFYGNITETEGANASVVKVGDSVQYLYGNNTYTGGTTITGGILVAGSNTALGSGPVLIDMVHDETHTNRSGGLGTGYGVTITNAVSFGPGGGVLGGYGTFASPGTITLGANAVVNPGDLSPATLSFTSGLAFAGGGSYDVTVSKANGSAGDGYDLLNITGSLVLTANSEDPFNLNLYSLTANGEQGSLADFNPGNFYSWTIIQTTEGFTDGEASLRTLPVGAFNLDYSAFSEFNSLNGGTFSLNISGNDLLLDFNPAAVPEPSTWALLLCGLAGVAIVARRRKIG